MFALGFISGIVALLAFGFGMLWLGGHLTCAADEDIGRVRIQ